MKDFYLQLVAVPKTVGIYFNKRPDGSLENQVHRTNTTQKKAYQFQYAGFSDYTVSLIKIGV